MAKKQRSFYLESDIMNYIESYQMNHDLSSISAALERIIFTIMMNGTVEVHETKKIDKPKEETKQSKLLANMKKTMKD